jgi:hypothetical protein
MSDQQAPRETRPLTDFHPRLTMNEADRRQVRKAEMREKYDERLGQAIEKGHWVLIRSDFPLFHPIIRHICGMGVMRSKEFIHLDVFDLDSQTFLQRGVPWDWVLEMWFFANRPPAHRVRALGIQSCHGIVLHGAEQFMKKLRAQHA